MKHTSLLRTLRAFFMRVGGVFTGSAQDREMAAEFESHLQMEIDDNLRAGMTPAEARRQAMLKTGGLALAQENYRARCGLPFIGTLLGDLQYAGRLLRRSPGFTFVAVLSLALGIGANTAIFTIINAVMLRSLPVEDPSRLVQIMRGENTAATNPIWEQIRDHQNAFSGTLAYFEQRLNLADGGESQFAQGMLVSGDFFRVLGVVPMKGRVFGTYDDRRGAPALAVISYGFWQRHFGADPQIVGRTVRLNRLSFEIAGVTPPWFTGLNVDRSFDVAIPIACEPLLHPDKSWLDQRSTWWLTVLGRLRPGESLQQASARMKLLSPQVNRATVPPLWQPRDQADYVKEVYTLRPSGSGFSSTRTEYRTALYALMAIVSLVLLIACANVANLLLARASARQREFAVRMAIGAGRWRIVRQLLTESLLLALFGAAGGLVLAQAGSRLLVRLISTTANPLEIDVSPDVRVLLFAIAAALVTALLFGLAPALRATRVELEPALKEHARGAVAGASRFHPGKALIAGQVALSLLVLVGAGLFLGTLRNLLTIDTGFDRRNVLVVNADVQQSGIVPTDRVRVYGEILDRIRAVPGVVSAACSGILPISGASWTENVHAAGVKDASGDGAESFGNRVSPDYFKTLRTPLLSGRDFTAHDDLHAPKIVILNATAARSFFGTEQILGKAIELDRPPGQEGRDLYEIVGVVKDAKYGTIDEKPRRTFYVPLAQDAEPWPEVHFEVRSSGSAERLIPGVRAAVAQVNRGVALEFRNYETQVDESILQPRVVALLSTGFGLLALLLAMVGLYGVTSYAVARRKGEIGIRMALGEQRQSVTWLMLRDVFLLLVLGLMIGLGAALAAGRLVASLLYGIQPNDPLRLSAAMLVLAVATAVAAYLPARRAARLDPMTALREE